jgi:hypothetical protein
MSCRPCGPSRSPVGRRVEGCGGVCSIALRACGRLTGRPSKPSTNHPPCDRMATDWRALSPSRRSRPWWPGAARQSCIWPRTARGGERYAAGHDGL